MSNKPRILFVCPLPPPVHGSSMVSKSIIDSKLVNEAFDVDFVNLSTSRSMAEIGKKSYSLYAKKAVRFMGSYCKVLWKLLTHRYDLTYLAITVHDVGFLKDCPFVLLARLLSKKYVIHQHNRGMAPYVHKAPYKWLLPMAYKNAKVILLSWRLYPDISEVVKKEQVMICPNGLVMPDFLKQDVEVKKGYQLPDGKMVPEILFLSNMVEAKGVWVLLDALKMLKERGVAFHCSFVGGASRYITFEIFAQGVADRGLLDNVVYIGPQYGDDKWRAYKHADVFVLPSMDDCLPLTVAEAMMCGVPVVASDMGAIPDLVEDGVTGYIISSDDLIIETGGKFLDWTPSAKMVEKIASGAASKKIGSTALANKLEVLLLNPILREQMGKNAQLRFNLHFTQEVFENRIVECLKSK